MTSYVALNNQTHKHLKVDTHLIDAQGANEKMVPVVVSEFLKLAVQYPIAFTKSAETGAFICVALLGFEENLFWQNNHWQAIYVPLNIQRQPFFIGQENNTPIICINPDSPVLNQNNGEPLFNDAGSASEYLNQMQGLLAELIKGEAQTRQFIDALLEHKLITPMSLDISFANGTERKVQGLYTIDDTKLAALDKEALFSLHQRNYLQSIYTLVSSTSQIYSLIQKKNERNGQESNTNE